MFLCIILLNYSVGDLCLVAFQHKMVRIYANSLVAQMTDLLSFTDFAFSVHLSAVGLSGFLAVPFVDLSVGPRCFLLPAFQSLPVDLDLKHK